MTMMMMMMTIIIITFCLLGTLEEPAGVAPPEVATLARSS
jgi:hypothetical protein